MASILAASTLFLAASGCGKKDAERSGDPESPRSPTASQPNEPAAPAAPGTQDPDLAIITITAVDIDTKLAAMCGIPESKVYFKYDSTKLSEDSKERLDQIATCAATGAAAGKDLLIVGRTDPVGSDAYNQQLGMSRAAAVGEYLRTKGVQKQRVEIESKGERNASANPWQWPDARRVTVRLQG